MYDCILSSVGRVPNGLNIGAEKAGVEVDEKGFISTDTRCAPMYHTFLLLVILRDNQCLLTKHHMKQKLLRRPFPE
ncbi:MAG: hypothetical protein CM1200mP30_34230 [Pseudomonadota bacterium]|nr:MAG: hypothetical protein CM1200mP30_34230 [Pseudomonadota bacterium]